MAAQRERRALACVALLAALSAAAASEATRTTGSSAPDTDDVDRVLPVRPVEHEPYQYFMLTQMDTFAQRRVQSLPGHGPQPTSKHAPGEDVYFYHYPPGVSNFFVSLLEVDSKTQSAAEGGANGAAAGAAAAAADAESEPDFRFLQDLSQIALNRASARATLRQSATAALRGEQKLVAFPEQDWTYKDLKNPPDWLVPKSMQPPGLPITKPPPVPAMVPPPPPFPAYLDNKGPYSGSGSESPPAPAFSLPRPPPAALPRWIPWSAYYAPGAGN
jgi:hypothetical protein